MTAFLTHHKNYYTAVINCLYHQPKTTLTLTFKLMFATF